MEKGNQKHQTGGDATSEEDFTDFSQQKKVEESQNGMDEVRANMCEPKPNHVTNNVSDLPAHGWSRRRN